MRVFSETVWRTETPSEHLRAFRASEHADMTRVPVRLDEARSVGHRVLEHFDMGREAMDTRSRLLEPRLVEMEERLAAAGSTTGAPASHPWRVWGLWVDPTLAGGLPGKADPIREFHRCGGPEGRGRAPGTRSRPALRFTCSFFAA